jgi:hypothetical protein
MFAITDYVVLAAVLLFGFLGARKGVLKTILGPISLLITSLFAFIYYKTTDDLTVTLVIAILGPFVLKLLFSLIIAIFNKIANKKEKISVPGQLLGALISIIWSVTILVFSIYLATLIPLNNPLINKVQNDIFSSRTYALLNKLTGNKASSSAKKMSRLTDALKDPESLKKLEVSPEYLKLKQNEIFQELLKDEKTVKQLQEKNIAALMQNPKIQELLKNKEFINALFELNKSMINNATKNAPSPTQDTQTSTPDKK